MDFRQAWPVKLWTSASWVSILIDIHTRWPTLLMLKPKSLRTEVLGFRVLSANREEGRKIWETGNRFVNCGMEMTQASTGEESVAPSTVLAYLDPNYWNERFKKEEHYEWFKDYSHFRHLIQAHINPNSSVLELGCGNSQLCEEMYSDGIADITCIDLSAVAVEKMLQRLSAKGYKEIKVLEADMLDLPFSDGCFDVVIEKGTMDVLFVNSGDPWNPRPATVTQVKAMLDGVHRVLKPDGIFISISFGQPHFRRPLFDAQEYTWSIEWSTFGDGFHYFFYILRKGKRSLDDRSSSERKIEVPQICLLQEELEGEDFIFRTSIDDDS